MVEVQAHGFTLQKWVCETFFERHRGSYGDEWDVLPSSNVGSEIPASFRGLPVSIKSTAYGASIGLGDILRQRRIAQTFIMIVGFWRQRTESEKWIEDIGVATFDPAAWSTLWGQLSLELVQEIDAIAKNRSLTPQQAQKNAQVWKGATPAVTSSAIVVNPKINSTNRRVQCSLRFDAFWAQVGREPRRQTLASLFGVEFPNPILSRARTFKSKRPPA